MTLPAGWHRARRNLTPQLTEPREILSVATYPLRYKRRARCGIGGCPTPALNGFQATDILVSIQERMHARAVRARTWRSISADTSGSLARIPGSCPGDRVAWYAFEAFAQAGRNLYVLAVVGKRAPARAREELKQLLGSLHFVRASPGT